MMITNQKNRCIYCYQLHNIANYNVHVCVHWDAGFGHVDACSCEVIVHRALCSHPWYMCVRTFDVEYADAHIKTSIKVIN